MSEVKLQRMGRNIVMSIIGPLVAYPSPTWIQNQHMHSSYVLVMHCEKMAVNDMSFCHTVIKFLVKEGKSAGVIYDQLCDVYGNACMGASSVRKWVKHFKDGNMDTAHQLCCG
jgi:cellulose synthase/poly-beta-1,6-N-acetylglucosamine synthase-like glycosyltransferase